ncbi:hypothetical protein GYMLUDRAFT_943302 [Collybiopsis luxurians FD-317 M1]|uniref:Uncharacterized protein n=1 Tax=Collybiopsis luxurians FD-317 M1 TaxID=944289 RepID=A0A0D0BUD3_9AGAR|nr:hypothetical protein GYMLUDRAFT_943302 [Collybiopsis luxurians FD-317 M1]
MAGVYEPSNNCEGTLALQQDIDSQESDSEPEGPDIDTDTSSTSHTTLQQGPSSQYRRQRESAYSGTSPPDLLRLLIDREYESSELHKTLQSAQRRAEEAKQQLAKYITRFQSLKEDKVRAEWKLQEELTLYKIRYELEQEERVKAKKEVYELRDQVEKARWDAMKAKEELKARAEGEWQELDTQGRSMVGSPTVGASRDRE